MNILSSVRQSRAGCNNAGLVFHPRVEGRRFMFHRSMVLCILFVGLVVLQLYAPEVRAHEEPCRTLKEKADKQKIKDRIVRADAKVLTTWKKTMMSDGQWSKESRTIRQEYDIRGNLIRIAAFRSDTLSEQAAYTYDDDGDLLTDTDLSPTGELLQSERYVYDSKGRVLSGSAYDGSRRFVSSFVYDYSADKRSVTFKKFKANNRFDYSIEFDYSKDYDISDYIGAVKKDSAGVPVQRVAIHFDAKGRVAKKDVMQDGSHLSFTYEYQYGLDDVVSEVTKILPDGTKELTNRYAINKNGLHTEMKSFDKEGKLVSVTRYAYEHNKP
ncbi:MAG TPA: hypothetical protein VMH23_03825 [Bacteroidota bacterium]|nr:hypothetical protein [Bacteroidota bacterium]